MPTRVEHKSGHFSGVSKGEIDSGDFGGRNRVTLHNIQEQR